MGDDGELCFNALEDQDGPVCVTLLSDGDGAVDDDDDDDDDSDDGSPIVTEARIYRYAGLKCESEPL